MAIDLLGKELTNIKKGFQSRLFGRRSLDEIRRDLGSDDTIYINDLPDDSILININNTYVKDMALRACLETHLSIMKRNSSMLAMAI